MKKKVFIGVGILLVALVAFVLYGVLVVSKRSPIETTTFSEKGVDIKVVYCRPYKKGRVIFGDANEGALQPYGKYWRLGANAATEITFSKNVNFAGKPLSAGTYRMYAVPGSSSFQLGLNSELGVYFAVNEPDYSLDVLKVDIPVTASPSEVEQLTINFSSDSAAINMDIVWDKTLLRVPITVQ